MRDAMRRRPWWADTALALFLTFVAFGAALSSTTEAEPHSLGALDAILLPFTTVPVALRRYRPLEVLGVTVAAETVLLIFSNRVQVPLGVLVALYTVASTQPRPIAARAGLWAAIPITAGVIVNTGPSITRIVPKLAFFAIAWVIGDNIRTRRAYLAELVERAERLERERELDARRAVAEEQTRIARELHDVIAHSVSVMVVQASAGEDVFEADPGRARAALASVAATGREALTELRRLLGALRPLGGEEAPVAPQPGLDRLDELLEQVRATGLEVNVRVEGDRRKLASGIELSAYRIVQEALTNTLKHADASRADVSLIYGEDILRIEIDDDGRASDGLDASALANVPGHGIMGMRERVGLHGGRLRAGPRPEGGYSVEARIPISASTP